ncbi:MAG TPA: rhomboid family intramembrane serine protease [Tepidisphaeraceae bacterium]|jgi:GlpG protein|nr:rhomboid family intramembrane serine protease [Tepidisphaeraceae bacterium]
MRRPPPLSHFLKFPIVSGTTALAIGVTLAWWSHKIDIDPLRETIEIRRGQLWRMLTSALPHANFLHLAFNVYWIWVFGTLVEETFGHVKTLAIFALLAVAANGAEYALLSGGIGLSGIGYGLFAFLWVLSRRDRRFADAMDPNTIQVFVAWFFICIVLTFTVYPIANIAHGAGAVAGALLGWAITPSPRRVMATAALTALIGATFIAATVARPWVNFSKEGGFAEAGLAYDALIADRNDEALRWSRDATRMQPRNANFWFNMGIACERLNRPVQSADAFKRARDVDPSNAEYQGAWQDSKAPER